MEVRTTVIITHTELRDLAIEKAKAVAGKDTGSSQCKFLVLPTKDGEPPQVSVEVSFLKNNR